MTDDLVDFLRARLDEDEQTAQGCIDEVGPEREGEPFTDGSGPADRDAFPSYPWGSMDRELAFMAGPGHPARVLAEVQAKRVLVEMHEQVPATPGRHQENPPATGCKTCDEWDGLTFAGGICETLCLLALPYAGHESYRAEWAPSVSR